MPVINRTNYPYLYTDRIEYRTNTFAYELRDWGINQYFYIEFLLGECFKFHSIKTLVPEDILENIKTLKNYFLVINNAHEAFHSVVEPIYQNLVVNEGIPPNKIILISESADIHNVVKDYAEKNKFECIRVEWIMMFKAGVKAQRYHQIKNNKDSNFQTLEDKEYPKKYLNFNRRWRLHRPALIALLAANDLLDDGYVSLGQSDCGTTWDYSFNWIKHRFEIDPVMSRLISSNKNKILNLPPLYLDDEDLMNNKADLSTSTDFYYSNSLLSLVSETNFFPEFETGRFLSEKTWKPVAYKHPFIMVGVPRTMELLRELGYKTFHPYIDETYDTENDPIRRLRLIVEEVKRIVNFNKVEMLDFMNNLRPIVEHNYKHLVTTDDFIKKML